MKTPLILLALFLSAAGCQNDTQGIPEDGKVYFDLGEHDRQYGDAKKAVANYTEAIRCYDSAHDQTMLAAAYFARGLANWRLLEKAEAEKDFAHAEDLGYPTGRRPRALGRRMSNRPGFSSVVNV